MYEDEDAAPEWLSYLERPKVTKLAHEFGAGAPCNACSFCPGLELHFWRKLCILCGCKLEDHLVEGDSFPQYDIVFGQSKVGKTAADMEGKIVFFDWVPPTKTPSLVGEYMSNLPETWRPITGSVGSYYRRKQLERQLPRYDVDPTACSALSSCETEALEKYQARLKEDAAGFGTLHKLQAFKNDGIFRAEPVWFIDPPIVEDVTHYAEKAELVTGNSLLPEDRIPLNCTECKDAFLEDGLVIRAARMGNALWHPRCFICAKCNELLVDLHYFHNSGEIYCGRHFAEAVDKRRCFACDELIFEKEYASANGQFFHNRHFCCSSCDAPLGGKQFIQKNENIMCPDCYQKEFNKVCSKCQNHVSPFEQRLEIRGKIYHKSPECFVCHFCSVTLQERRTFLYKNNLLCENHVPSDHTASS